MRSRDDDGERYGGGEDPTPVAFEDAAFTGLYRGSRGRVLGYLIGLDRLLGREVAEELVQESFVLAWRRWTEVRGYDQPLAWVIRTAQNLWLNHRRAGLRHPVDPLTDRDGWLELGETDLLEAVELRMALDGLPLRQRQVLLLRFFVDLTVGQTADVLGIASGTVTWTTSEALAALRDRLDPEGRGRRG